MTLADSRRTREHIEDLLGDREHHVRVAAVDALASLADPKSHPAMRRALEREHDPRIKRRLREALRDTSESRAADKKRLVFPGGHSVPRTEMIKESLQWLDKYLGPAR